MGGQFHPPAAAQAYRNPQHAKLVAELKHPRALTQAEVEDWRKIQAASPCLDSPFFSPEFTLAVGEAREDTRVAVLRQGDTVAGFFPFHLTPRAIGKPVGGTFSDYQGPILRPGLNVSPEALLKACRLRAYDFNHCPVDLAPLANSHSLRAISPRVIFRDGFDTYLSNSEARTRASVKDTDRRLRKLEREKDKVTFRFDDRRPESWEWLVETKTRALANEGVKAGFSVPWVDALNTRLRTTHSAHFSGLVSTLSCGEELIAAHFGLRAGPVLCWWQTTYSVDYRQYAPGLALILYVLREGGREGLNVIDMGRGPQPYKLVFANDQFELCEGAIARKGSVARQLRKGQEAASAFAERLPLGKYQNLPRRAFSRLISNVRLP